MSYSAIICKIKVSPIPNAEKIQVANCAGYTAIVGIDNKDGELDGPLAKDFKQAIRLEGTKVHMGKHAAGVIISSIALSELCPMVIDSKGSSQLQYTTLPRN